MIYEMAVTEGLHTRFIKLYFYTKCEAIAEAKTHPNVTLYEDGGAGKVIFQQTTEE